MQKISSPLTQFVRYLPLAIIVFSWIGAWMIYWDTHNPYHALALGGSATIVAILIFVVYSFWLWNVSVDSSGVLICTRFSKRIEVRKENIRNIELFPDILFRGQVPQYVINLKVIQSGRESLRFYPTVQGKKMLEQLMVEKRRNPSARRRR